MSNYAYFSKVANLLKKQTMTRYRNKAEKLAKLWKEYLIEQMEFSYKRDVCTLRKFVEPPTLG